MNPAPARTPQPITTQAGLALLAALVLIVAGILAAIWIGGWLFAITGVLLALIPFAVAAWHMGSKVEPK